MCLIIMQAAGATLPAEHFANGWSHNPDGAGYAFVNSQSGNLEIRKPFWKLKDLRKSYAADHAAHGASSPFVIHFRYATHGGKTEENCHPHPLSGGNVALVHNGVLHDFEPPYGSKISDTVHFCRTVLAYRCAAHLVDETFRKILGDMIGSGNKFVLLSHTREVSIVNESAGVWDGPNWYSNGTYKAPSQFGKFKRGAKLSDWYKPATSAFASAVLPSHYAATGKAEPLFSYGPAGSDATASGRADEWDDGDADVMYDLFGKRETAEEEHGRLQSELDEWDAAEWESLPADVQEQYIEMYHRVGELERELDSRLR